MDPLFSRILARGLAFLLCVSAAVPAAAQISAPAGPVDFDSGFAIKYRVAFDTVNQVYLVIWDDSASGAQGQFLDKQGNKVGGPFNVATPGSPDGWVNITFGGAPSNPKFLVTYVTGNGSNNPKWAKLVGFSAGGVPVMGTPRKIADLWGEWSDSDVAQSVWTGQQYVVSWRAGTNSNPALPWGTTLLVGLDINGNIATGVQSLGDNLDHEVNANLACSPTVCLATGFGIGVPFTSRGATWARFFNPTTLAPIGNVFYPDDHTTIMEDQRVAYNTLIGKFQLAWVRGRQFTDFRLVTPGGSMSALDLSRSMTGGQLGMAYNSGTQTTLLVLARSDNNLHALELGTDGFPANLNNIVRVSDGAGDKQSSSYFGMTAANGADGQWLVAYTGYLRGRSTLVQGTGGTGGSGIGGTLASPTPGSTLTGTNVTFAWNAGVSASNYTLQVGSSLGGAQYFSGSTTGLTLAVTGLPINGSTVYVRLTTTFTDNTTASYDYTFAAASPGATSIVAIAGPTDFDSGFAIKYRLAFDTVNQVYLVIWDDSASGAQGQFLNKLGNKIGNPFKVATPGSPDGWVNITFGGPPTNPKFLVTYVTGNGSNNPKWAKLVGYSAGGVPVMGTPKKIADLWGEWSDSDIAQSVWTGQHFVISWRAGTNSSPALPWGTTLLVGLDINGNFTTGVQALGDNFDHEVNANIACSPTLCLATGFGIGVPFTSRGATWARFFNPTTLAPIGNVFYPDDHTTIMEDQRVAYNTSSGKFQLAWVRGRQTTDFRLVDSNGSMNALDLTRSLVGGQLSMAYNPLAQTTLLTMARSDNNLHAVELGANGYPINLNNIVRVSDGSSDKQSSSYFGSVAANPADATWLVTYTGYLRGRATLVQHLGAKSPAALTSPTVGSRLPGASATFAWSAGFSAATYTLQVGSSVGGAQYFSGSTSGLSLLASGLPVNGSTVHVRLTTTFTDSTTASNDYTFLAALPAPTASLEVSPESLSFTVVKSGSVIDGGTPRAVSVTFAITPLAWTAVASVPWLQVTGGAGSGNGQFTVTVINPGDVIGSQTSLTGSVVLTAPGAANSPITLPVTLTVSPSLPPAVPFGQVDTPVQNAAGVQGALAITGWALDNAQVSSLDVYRNCLAFEPQANCQMVLGTSMVWLGKAMFIAGARADIEASFPLYPNANRAGWGLQILTNTLPHIPNSQMTGGQGPLTLYAVATDNQGNKVSLGRSYVAGSPTFSTPTSITLANDTIAKPFGMIDRPALGQTVSGIVPNFGWVLTPDADTIQGNGDTFIHASGNTIGVWIDGVLKGTVTYSQCRGTVGSPVPAGVFCNDDISNIFGNATPQAPLTLRSSNPTRFRNLDATRAAIGSYLLDTTQLSNGLHTIAWSVMDSAGRSDGVGSRFFTVLNPAPAALQGATSVAKTSHLSVVSELEHLPVGDEGVWGRTGFDARTSWQAMPLDANGERRVRLPEMGRLELSLGSPIDQGYLVANGELRPLPAGSTLDGATFSWAPGPGLVGEYVLVFVRGSQRIEVQVTIATRVSKEGQSEVRMNLDTPSVGGLTGRSVTVSGWALDPDSAIGSGIEAVHVWARRLTSQSTWSAAKFLGAAVMDEARPDVAQSAGARFGQAGFSLTATLERGEYELTVYVWNRRTSRWEDARSVVVTVR